MNAIEQLAPAKVNLGLHVLRKRSDGFHDIESVFVAIPWADRLTIEPASEISMTCSDPSLPTDERNLVMKAARALADRMGVRAGAGLHLDKRLPYGAGLGGGSSDAASALLGLCRLWKLSPPRGELMELAAQLGSDVPFFLMEGAALGTGRGEVLAPLVPGWRRPGVMVVIVPPVHVSTPMAYGLVRPNETERPDLRALVEQSDLQVWRGRLVNDFQEPICEAFPEVRQGLDMLLGEGARYAALSGSGSAVFGLFQERPRAVGAFERAEKRNWTAWIEGAVRD